MLMLFNNKQLIDGLFILCLQEHIVQQFKQELKCLLNIEMEAEPKNRYKPLSSPSITNETDKSWDLVFLRNTRNSLLQLTDKYLIPDYPITPENLEIIKLYRQELRDFINKNKEGILNGVIPEIPPIPF
jgi:hypothetical protein